MSEYVKFFRKKSASPFPLGERGRLSGAEDVNRTRDLLITNQLLCRLSYSSKLSTSGTPNHKIPISLKTQKI